MLLNLGLGLLGNRPIQMFLLSVFVSLPRRSAVSLMMLRCQQGDTQKHMSKENKASMNSIEEDTGSWLRINEHQPHLYMPYLISCSSFKTCQPNEFNIQNRGSWQESKLFDLFSVTSMHKGGLDSS